MDRNAPSPPNSITVSASRRRPVALELRDLLHPVSLNTFRDLYWEKTYLHISRSNPRFLVSIFSFADVDRCIFTRRTDVRPSLTLVPPPNSGQMSSHHRISEITNEKLYAAFNSGATIRLEAVQESWAPIATLISSIEEALSITVGVNMYMTPANSQGFQLHYDPHDVLVLQVDGAKDWYIYEPPLDLPVNTEAFHSTKDARDVRINEEDCTLLQRVQLKKGDLLYLPRGFPHKALAASEASLHLTIALHPVFWYEFLRQALEVAAASESRLRASLPPGFLWDSEAQERCRALLPGMIELGASQIDFAGTLQAISKAAAKRQFDLPDGHFETLLKAGNLQLGDRMQRRAGLHLKMEMTSEQATLRAGEVCLSGPVALASALSYVQRNRRFCVGDLPGLTESGRVTLVRKLILQGIVTHDVQRQARAVGRTSRPAAETARPGRLRTRSVQRKAESQGPG
jgi:ribosomal protein L16 Arg81 hydroxylase